MTKAEYKAKYGRERAAIKAELARNRSDVTAATFEKHMKFVEEDAEELRDEGVSEYEVEEFKKRQRKWLAELAGIGHRNFERSDDRAYRKAMGKQFVARKRIKRRARSFKIGMGTVALGVAAFAAYKFLTREKA